MKKYWEPTPRHLRKLGDSILIASVGLQGLMTSAPVDGDTKQWLVLGIGALGVVGKIMTNFFSDTSTE